MAQIELTAYIADPSTNNALASGKIYIGQPDTDPTLPANQIQLRAVQEDGSLVNIAQPVRTSVGGVPIYNGSPILIDAEETLYSMRVDSQNDVQKYYFARVGSGGTSGREALIAMGGLPFDSTVTVTDASYAVTDTNTNALIKIDATNNDVTINLPSASVVGDKFQLYFKRIDSNGSATVTIDANGSDVIDGDGTVILPEQYDFLKLICDGIGWHIVSFVQGINDTLQALAALTLSANKIPYFDTSTSAATLDLLDEDDMSSDSATALATQQSIKAYVDANTEKVVLRGAQDATGQTAVNFESIPSGVKQIWVNFSGLAAGTGHLVQIGDTDGYDTTGYEASNAGAAYTEGFPLFVGTASAANASGSMLLTLVDPASNLWVCSGSCAVTATSGGVYASAIGGSKAMNSTLDRVRIKRIVGSTMARGTINIHYV